MRNRGKRPRTDASGDELAETHEDRDWVHAELDLALAIEDCPICVITRQTEDSVLSWIASTNIREHETIGAIARTGGLCGPHWRDLLSRLGRAPGIDAARLLLEVARNSIETDGGETICRVCASVRRSADTSLDLLIERFRRSDVARMSLEVSFGLCRPHFDSARTVTSDPQLVSVLALIQRHQTERLMRVLSVAERDRELRGRWTRLLSIKLAGSIRVRST